MAKGNTSVFEWRTGAAPSVSCVHVGGGGRGRSSQHTLRRLERITVLHRQKGSLSHLCDNKK